MVDQSLFGSSDSLSIFAALAGIVAIAWLVGTSKWGSWLSPAPIVVVLAVAASNARLIPFSSDAYQFVSGHMLPFGVALLLLSVDVRKTWKGAGVVLSCFGLGVAASMLGIMVALAIASPGETASALAALYSAVVSGGAVNMVSVGEATGVFQQYPELLAGVIAGSVPIDVAYIALMTSIAKSKFVSNAFAGRISRPAEAEEDVGDMASSNNYAASPPEFAYVAAIAIAVVAVCKTLAAAVGQPQLAIVGIGTVSLLLGSTRLAPVSAASSMQPIALWCLFMFLATVTVGADLRSLTEFSVRVAIFVAVVYAVHVSLLLSIGWLLRYPLDGLIVGSLAGVAGPATTAAIAAAQGWKRLVVPGSLCATFGLAIGTYVGLAVYGVLSAP